MVSSLTVAVCVSSQLTAHGGGVGVIRLLRSSCCCRVVAPRKGVGGSWIRMAGGIDKQGRGVLISFSRSIIR